MVNFTLWHPHGFTYLILCSCADVSLCPCVHVSICVYVCMCLMISTIHFSMDYFFLFVPSMLLKPFLVLFYSSIFFSPLDNLFFSFSLLLLFLWTYLKFCPDQSISLECWTLWWWYTYKLASVSMCICSHTHLTTIEQQQWTNNGNNFPANLMTTPLYVWLCMCNLSYSSLTNERFGFRTTFQMTIISTWTFCSENRFSPFNLNCLILV